MIRLRCVCEHAVNEHYVHALPRGYNASPCHLGLRCTKKASLGFFNFEYRCVWIIPGPQMLEELRL